MQIGAPKLPVKAARELFLSLDVDRDPGDAFLLVAILRYIFLTSLLKSRNNAVIEKPVEHAVSSTVLSNS